MGQSALYLILASCLYGIMPCFTKQATAMLNTQTYLFLGNAMGFLLVNAVLAVRGTRRRVDGPTLRHVLVFGCLPYVGTAVFLTTAYQCIAAGVSTMIHFIYPVLVTVVMVVGFREKLSRTKVLAVACAVGGVALIADLSGGLAGQDPAKGVAFALCSSVTYGAFVVANDKSRFAKLDAFVLFFYLTGFSAAVFGAFTLLTGTFVFSPSPLPYFLCLCNQSCNLCAVVLFALGVRRIGASTGAVINMLEPAVSMLSSVLIFHDAVTASTWAGCALILCSVLTVSLARTKRGQTVS